MKGTRSALLMCALSVGCASHKQQPQLSFYRLPALYQSGVEGSVGLPASRVQVVRVTTTEILAQTGIVTSTRDGRVIVANYHHWSELPEFSLQRQLNTCLQKRNPRRSGKISLDVTAFQSDGHGGSLLAGQWQFAPAAKPRATQQYSFSYPLALSDDGYTALAAALARSLEHLCADIEKQLR